jgi:prevent-host-death family protein
MKTMSISEFKARALKVIEDVFETREELVITKRGKPVARVIPFQEYASKSKPGKLSKYFVSEKDIVSPLGAEDWEVSE